MKKLIITLLVLTALAAIALPKFVGTQGTRIHNDFFQKQAQQLLPGVEIQSEKLDDGWFNSEGQHRIKLSESFLKKVIPGVKNIELDKEVDLLVNTKFHHGPFAFGSFGSKGGSFSPVLAVSESTFKVDKNGEQIDFPGKLFTQVSPTGSGGKAKYVIEQYSKNTGEAQIDFEGLDIDFDISSKGEIVNGDGETGKLSITGDQGQVIQLSKMKFNTDVEDNGGIWFGDTSLKFDELSINDGQGVSFSLNDVAITGGNDGNNSTMQSDVKFTVGDFEISEMKFEDFTFDYTMDNIDTQAMSSFKNKMREMQRAGTPSPGNMMDELKKLIAKSPTINLKEFSVKTPQGKVHADLRLGLPKEIDMGFFPLSLLPQIQGDANLRIPKNVVALVDNFKPGIAGQLEFLQQMGMIKLDGGDYIAKVKMQEGESTVNGNPVPLPGLF